VSIRPIRTRTWPWTDRDRVQPAGRGRRRRPVDFGDESTDDNTGDNIGDSDTEDERADVVGLDDDDVSDAKHDAITGRAGDTGEEDER